MNHLLHVIRSLLLLILLAGCAVAPVSAPNPESVATTTTEQPSETAAAPASGEETRSFEHALGVSEIPTGPQRVALLNVIALDAALLRRGTPPGAPTTIPLSPSWAGRWTSSASCRPNPT